MYTISPVSNKIPDFLNKKYLEWQIQEGQRKTVEEFGKLFGAGKSLISHWMNGNRSPGPKYKERIIQRFGPEAIQAFGEDPDLYYIQKNWDELTPAERQTLREQVHHYRTKNERKTTSKR